MSRSVRVSINCIPRVKSALRRNAYISQRLLALELGISQATVSNFLNGKPVDYSYFIEICLKLGLEWQDIADLEAPIEEEETPSPVTTPQRNTVEFPEGRVKITSPYYIERPPREQRCFEEISKPGSLIRIKAPRQMGKTSLLARILDEAEKQGDRTVELNLQLATHRCFTNSDTFLKWFCGSIAMGLQLPNKLDNCWDLAEIVGSNLCCKAYFEEYLLPEENLLYVRLIQEQNYIAQLSQIHDILIGWQRDWSSLCDRSIEIANLAQTAAAWSECVLDMSGLVVAAESMTA